MGMLQNNGSRPGKSLNIRKKLIFTLLMLVIFRIGSNIPVPGINRAILDQMFSAAEHRLVCSV